MFWVLRVQLKRYGRGLRFRVGVWVFFVQRLEFSAGNTCRTDLFGSIILRVKAFCQ